MNEFKGILYNVSQGDIDRVFTDERGMYSFYLQLMMKESDMPVEDVIDLMGQAFGVQATLGFFDLLSGDGGAV